MKLKKYDCTLSVILPVYNEEENLRLNLPELTAVLDSLVKDYEVLIVDDGSTDTTVEIAEGFGKNDPRIKLIRHEKNLGPGSGIVTAAPLAKNDYIIFLPADIALRLEQLHRFFDAAQNADIVVGVSSARSDYTWFRKLSSLVYILLVKILFRLPQRQFNYIHLYSREVIRKCPPQTKGVFISVEMLVRGRAAGFSAAEVDVDYVPREHGTASCGRPSVILKTISDTLAFWWNNRK